MVAGATVRMVHTDHAVDDAYAAWPERLFIVTPDAKIAYAGKRGPWGFKPDHIERWPAKHVGPIG